MKLLDVSFLSECSELLLLDSDVFVFESLDMLDAYFDTSSNVFLRDYQYAFALGAPAFKRFSAAATFLPINTGLGLVKASTLDLDRVEFVLKHAPEILKMPQWSEQTLYALLSSSVGINLLGPSFVVAQGPGAEGLTLKHYVGGVRELAFTEGLPIIRAKLAKQRQSELMSVR